MARDTIQLLEKQNELLKDTISSIGASSSTAPSIAAVPTTRLKLMGLHWTQAVSTATPIEFRIHNGTSSVGNRIFDTKWTSGTVFGSMPLGEHYWYGPQGIAVDNGIFIDFISGCALITLLTKVESSG